MRPACRLAAGNHLVRRGRSQQAESGVVHTLRTRNFINSAATGGEVEAATKGRRTEQ
jgi:hypothetical protein